jgi:hypothetical protein
LSSACEAHNGSNGAAKKKLLIEKIDRGTAAGVNAPRMNDCESIEEKN